MDKKTTGIVAYLTWIGWLIALLAGDKEGAKFHINQALVILLFSLLSIIPCIGWIWGIFMIVCWFIGFIAAINEEDVTFAQEGGRVELTSSDGDYLEVMADSAEPGSVYSVCFIKNNDGKNSLTKCGGDSDHPEVMELSTAFEKIPGFSLICNS